MLPLSQAVLGHRCRSTSTAPWVFHRSSLTADGWVWKNRSEWIHSTWQVILSVLGRKCLSIFTCADCYLLPLCKFHLPLCDVALKHANKRLANINWCKWTRNNILRVKETAKFIKKNTQKLGILCSCVSKKTSSWPQTRCGSFQADAASDKELCEALRVKLDRMKSECDKLATQLAVRDETHALLLKKYQMLKQELNEGVRKNVFCFFYSFFL